MKIGLLVFSPGTAVRSKKVKPDISMLREAALKLGHEVSIIKFERCQMLYDRRGARVLYNGKKFPKFDVIIPRPGSSGSNLLKVSLVKQLEMMRIPVVNRFLPTVNAKNKLRTLQILAHKGIPIPRTVVVRRLEYIDVALRKIGKMPVILKTSHGSLGVGVAIVESRRSLVSALDIFWEKIQDDVILIQEYIRESEGKDIRVFIVGGKIVAAMKRVARKGEFRSNIHLGGVGQIINLTQYERKLALGAARALKLDVAGVDLLEKNGGAVVMEVNCNPGFEGIVTATGINVAEEMVKYAVLIAKGKRQKFEDD